MADPTTANPNWTLEVAKIAVPVVLGALVWAGQLLAQRAWTAYEQRRDVYFDVVFGLDSLLQGSTRDERRNYLGAIRKLWLVGSDEVVRAANALSHAIKNSQSSEYEQLYGALIFAMRRDLTTRKWLPPGETSLVASDFPVEGPGQ
ncbi:MULTISPECIES: hypothetical protein [Burkholderia]|uniref:hypothetical protein n=1 Tax=Burkholderia TaxID=32008 RepID=UPI001582BFEC|nr:MULTISPECIES: hypothetical protein [Burkholderia]